MGQLRAIDNGERTSLKGTTSAPTMYAAEWLAAIPHPYYIIGGPELREAVGEIGRRMTAAVATEAIGSEAGEHNVGN